MGVPGNPPPPGLAETELFAVDAYRTDITHKEELGPSASLFNLGYRVANLILGAVALILRRRRPRPR